MADASGGWTIIPPSVSGGAAPVNFPAIDAARGPGGAAKMLADEKKLGGGWGFGAEMIAPIADEINAGVSAASDWVRSGFDVPISDLYGEYKTIAQTERDQYRKENPGSALAANVLGAFSMGAPSAAPAGNAIVGGITSLAKQGAGWGAATGAAEGEGYEGRIKGAVGGAVGGAILAPAVGMASGLVFDLTKRTYGAVQRLTGLKGQAAVERAQAMVTEALRRDGITPADLLVMQTRGKPLTIADLGPNTRAVVGAASRQGGEGKAVLESFLEDRTQGQYGRITADVAGATGAKGEQFYPRQEVLARNRGQDAAVGYSKAYAVDAAPLSANGASILETPGGRSAVETATKMMQNKRLPTTDEAGNYTVEMLDQIQRAMRDGANKASGERAGEMAGNLNALRQQFLDELPVELRQAMADYRSQSELLDALETGRQFLRGDTETIAEAMRNFTPAQANMFRLGVARELRAKMGTKLDSGDISGMFQNPQIRERLGAIFPSKRLFQEFLESVKTERTMQMTRNAILKGSDTSARNVANDEFGSSALGEFASDVATGGATHGVVKAVTNAVVRGKDRYLAGVNEQVAKGVAGLATDTNLAGVGAQLSTTPAPTGTALAITTGAGPRQIGRTAARVGGPALGGAFTPQLSPSSGWQIIPPEAQR